ncbi:hypothetical protein Micbo1qcDRAFT_156917 [Microdochium bolleyi]|uniref:SP-RING-type domain-containing protein n=1 Tax=Microdochium bolleyi TaxID=196109 RepID=A0A136JD89_9PEZI|nr:hypothetical protein Micbo1qcDRAFT_156917 [Microdochium bolleyi]
MDELLGQLHMHSHVLQIIVFRASRRTAGVADGPVAMQMELLFKEDQRFHTAQDGNFMLKTHDAAYTRYLETINTRYKQMVQLSRGQQNIAVRAHSQQEHQPLPQYTHPPANAVPGHGPPRVDHVSPLLAQNQQWSVLPSQASPKMVGASHFQTTQVHHDHGSATARQMQAPPGYPGVNSPSTMSPQVQSPTSLAPLQYSVQPWANSAQERQQFVEANRHQSRAMTSFGESPIQLHPTLRNAQYPLVGSPVLNQSPVFPSAVMNARSSSGSPIVWPHAFPSPTTTNAFNVQGRRPSQPQAQQPVPAKQIANGLLFPTPEYRLPINEYPSDPQDNTCVLHSLHQAHVRSPRRFPVHSETAHERHYQSVRKLALGPVPVPPAKMIHKFSFSLSAKDQDRLSRTEILPGLDVSVHRYASGSLRLRIRCCYLAGSQPQITDSEWVTKDMVWPEHLFIEVNRFSLSLRRKAHHSKDLPVDIPANILLEENSVHVWVPETHLRPRDVPKDSQPYIAIELVETLSHSAILSLVRTHGVQSLSSTLEVIKRRLAGSSACKNDDDLAMISHELAIDLADPFTSTIFKIPVRGSNCTHLECFDLETWLNTRLGKKKICTCGKDSGSCKTCPSEPSFVDKWKCPLCSADARPYSLRIDQWLQGVRDKLEARGQLRAKSIFVTADGTWKIKDLPDEDDDDDDSGNDNGDVLKTANVNTANVKRAGNISRAGTVAAAGPGTASSAPIVIEIDDD